VSLSTWNTQFHFTLSDTWITRILLWSQFNWMPLLCLRFFTFYYFIIYVFFLSLRRLFAARIALSPFFSFVFLFQFYLSFASSFYILNFVLCINAKIERSHVTFLICAWNFSCLMLLLTEREISSLYPFRSRSCLLWIRAMVPRHCNNYRSKAHFSSLSISMQPDNCRWEESFAYPHRRCRWR